MRLRCSCDMPFLSTSAQYETRPAGRVFRRFAGNTRRLLLLLGQVARDVAPTDREAIIGGGLVQRKDERPLGGFSIPRNDRIDEHPVLLDIEM